MKFIGLSLILALLCGTMALAAGLPQVAIITTGGTIAEKIDPKTGGAVPAVSGDDLIRAVPGLSKLAKLKVINFSNIDSSQMSPELWARLSQVVDGILRDPKIKGAVVTHGTDTMAEGAYFLDLTLKSKKPVVFTGAMRSAGELSADGPINLLDAVAQVCSDNSRDWGVTVTLNQFINSAREVRKTNTTNAQTFQSGPKGYLGYLVGQKVVRLNDRTDRLQFSVPEKLPEVPLITMYAGMDGRSIRQAADSGVKGMVIEAVGAGNVDEKMFEALKYVLKKKIPVVITSRVYYGGVYPLYGDKGGGATLQKAGAILGGDLDGPKARLLLMLAIANGKTDQLKNFFGAVR